MLQRSAIFRRLLALLLICAGFFPIASHGYKTKIKTKSTADFVAGCVKTDEQKLVSNNDIVGLISLDTYCNRAFELTKEPRHLVRAARARIFMAQYVHRFKRPNGHPVLAEPSTHLSEATELLDEAEKRGVPVSAVRTLVAQVESSVKQPISSRFDSSIGAACALDSPLPLTRENMESKINKCKEAYNQRPVAILAYKYASALFFLSKTEVIWREVSYTDGLFVAYLAREFMGRADDDGLSDPNMIALIDNLVEVYERRVNMTKTIDTIGKLIGIAAVAVSLNNLVSGTFATPPPITTDPSAASAIMSDFELDWRRRNALPTLP